MSNLVRTTITVPEPIYNQARMLATSRGESFSSFIAGILNQRIKGKKKREKVKNPLSTLGKYSLGDSAPYKNRGELYDEHLKRKMGL